MDRGRGVDLLAGLKEDGPEYTVYDSHYEKIGKVDDVIVDEDDWVLYVGVKMGFWGNNSTLVPAEIVRINDRRQLIEVSEPAETIRHAPHFGRSEDLTPELENHVRTYFGLESLRPSPDHEPQGPDIPDTPTGRPEDWVENVPIDRIDIEIREEPAPARRDDDFREESARERVGPAEHEPIDRQPVNREPRDREPVESEPVERDREERERERTGSDRPLSERRSEEPEDRWESWRSGSGVTVHRPRR